MQSRLYDLATQTFDAIVAAWPADPLDAAPLPERRYVAFGIVPVDCEQFTVSIIRSYSMEADVAFEAIVSNPVFQNRSVELDVQIIRCVPDLVDAGETVEPPASADIQASALIAATDEQTLRDVLIDTQQAGDLATWSGLAFGNWTAQGPSGGMGGGSLRVRLALY